jgi:hypothetical protein
VASRRKKPRNIRAKPVRVDESRLAHQLQRGQPLSAAEEKARILVAKMENRLRKMAHGRAGNMRSDGRREN